MRNEEIQQKQNEQVTYLVDRHKQLHLVYKYTLFFFKSIFYVHHSIIYYGIHIYRLLF